MTDSEKTDINSTSTVAKVEKSPEKIKKNIDIAVKLVKSGIGKSKDQKETIKGLGFKRLNQTVTLKDTPCVRGMVDKISHLVKVQQS